MVATVLYPSGSDCGQFARDTAPSMEGRYATYLHIQPHLGRLCVPRSKTMSNVATRKLSELWRGGADGAPRSSRRKGQHGELRSVDSTVGPEDFRLRTGAPAAAGRVDIPNCGWRESKLVGRFSRLPATFLDVWDASSISPMWSVRPLPGGSSGLGKVTKLGDAASGLRHKVAGARVIFLGCLPESRGIIGSL
jgi:hypothetical protein